MDLVAATRYELHGAVAGTVDTTSATGKPLVSVGVRGADAQYAQVRESIAGLEITGVLTTRPDLDSRQLILLLPRVNVTDAPVDFAAVAIVVTAKTTIGGPGLIIGSVHSYEIYPVAGRASVVTP